MTDKVEQDSRERKMEGLEELATTGNQTTYECKFAEKGKKSENGSGKRLKKKKAAPRGETGKGGGGGKWDEKNTGRGKKCRR